MSWPLCRNSEGAVRLTFKDASLGMVLLRKFQVLEILCLKYQTL